MFVFSNSNGKVSPTIIGAGAEIAGNIRTEHTVQIHGRVNGDVSADIVVVGKGGSVAGKVNANILFLHGEISGPVRADTANIYANAILTGTLYYDKLNIMNNSKLECKLVKKA
ncbi:MAG: polymer-forming cytoskeletal protein [Rickettsiales bacterium]|jgi:cytoskeletal protein CcmA (bactofilin family)|nr:polymer-forming cytoskeletal protein [Rickettsiales bacterium]